MQKKFKIKGMHCNSCEVLIKDSLEELGINVEKINHKTGELIVEFDENKISIEKIKEAIKKEGYKL